jgi:acid phosphatase family membrane protein YuiD
VNALTGRPRLLGALGIVALAFCLVWPMQGGGGVPNSHYVLVKSLARGTPVVERALGELGDFSTNDVATFEGRTYSNKAPGFAFVTLPPYLLLDAAGMRTTGDPARILWALGLWSVVLPTLLLVLVVRERAERLQPGFGTATAVTLGMATLVLPYGTLFLSHALSALLVFAAFALLWREREGPPRPRLVAVAGLLAGYAVTTEYPNALALAALALYALTRAGRLRRALAYGAGAAVGLLPLALYNLWSFDSLTHVTYSGVSGRPAADQWGAPSPAVALELLLSANGLLVLTPVMAFGALGAVLLHRRGFRAEALLVGGLPLAYLALDSAYFSPFGGFSPGPRYLVAVVPLLAFPLALAYRALPATTGALAVVSATIVVALTATRALAGYDGRWLDRLADRETTPTAATLVGVTGWYAILPFLLAAAAAAACALLASAPPILRPAEAALGGVAALAWAAVAAWAPRGGDAGELRQYGAAAAVAALSVAAAVAARAYALRGAPRSVARHVR